MGGGIIINRAKVLLIAVTDPCLYGSLSATTKALVDTIDAKDPAARTEHDVQNLMLAITEAVRC